MQHTNKSVRKSYRNFLLFFYCDGAFTTAVMHLIGSCKTKIFEFNANKVNANFIVLDDREMATEIEWSDLKTLFFMLNKYPFKNIVRMCITIVLYD